MCDKQGEAILSCICVCGVHATCTGRTNEKITNYRAVTNAHKKARLASTSSHCSLWPSFEEVLPKAAFRLVAHSTLVQKTKNATEHISSTNKNWSGDVARSFVSRIIHYYIPPSLQPVYHLVLFILLERCNCLHMFR